MKRPFLLFALLALCSFALPALALPRPTAASFDKGAVFTVSGYAGQSPLSGFPVLRAPRRGGAVRLLLRRPAFADERRGHRLR